MPGACQAERPPAHAVVTVVDKNGPHRKQRAFYVRMNNGTRAVDGDAEIDKYIADRWDTT